MKVTFFIFALFLFYVFIVGGCKKTGGIGITGGGIGGNVTINLIPEHHDSLIDSCVFYIKYGTLDAPSDSVYDDSTFCKLQAGIPIATFQSLTPGIYYIYGKGYHSTYAPPYVKGGKPITIYLESTDTTVYIATYSYDL
jgi:hypothetical protein